MRLAPVPMFYAREPRGGDRTIRRKLPHHPRRPDLPWTPAAISAACIVGALNGADKETLLVRPLLPRAGYWEAPPAGEEIAEIAAGSFKHKNPPQIRGAGYVVKSLEAALWAFYAADSFRDGCLLAVNLGNDADTTGAVYGQMPGHIMGKKGFRRNGRPGSPTGS